MRLRYDGREGGVHGQSANVLGVQFCGSLLLETDRFHPLPKYQSDLLAI